MPEWFIAKCTSARERQGEETLMRLGAVETFVPVEKVRTSERIRKAARAKGKPIKTHTLRCWAPGYVFFRAEDVDMHRINGTHPGKLWLRVMTQGDKPRAVSEAEFLKMKALPGKAAEIVAAAQEAERAERLAKMPRIGDTAKVIDGILTGLSGQVTAISSDHVKIDIGPRTITIPAVHAERA